MCIRNCAFVKQYLVKAFGEEEALEMLRILRDILKQDIPLKEVTSQIKGRMDYPSRLQLIHLIYGIAQADGSINDHEMNVIEADRLGSWHQQCRYQFGKKYVFQIS